MSFAATVDSHSYVLKELQRKLQCISPFSPSVFKLAEVGYLLKMFYILHNDKHIEKSIQYSAGFMGYIHNLKSIKSYIDNGDIHFATFTKNKTKIKNQYYPPYINSKHVKNDCYINKMIITGPNASGKTTQLKTSALNIIFTQQYGVGFYESCALNPYDYIHSYLNIPDTSDATVYFKPNHVVVKKSLTLLIIIKTKTFHHL